MPHFSTNASPARGYRTASGLQTEASEPVESLSEDGDGPFTKNDLNFLKSLRISLTDDTDSDTNNLPDTFPDTPEA